MIHGQCCNISHILNHRSNYLIDFHRIYVCLFNLLDIFPIIDVKELDDWNIYRLLSSLPVTLLPLQMLSYVGVIQGNKFYSVLIINRIIEKY